MSEYLNQYNSHISVLGPRLTQVYLIFYIIAELVLTVDLFPFVCVRYSPLILQEPYILGHLNSFNTVKPL